MKKILKDIFNFENFKLGMLMSNLSNNPDPLVISYLKNRIYNENEVNKNSNNKKAA
ncbi:hypothetical protein ACJDT4_09185 [Clostridium neuense]|uniref:Uncharacterized protein n=1 Tax=Clostridium neuense TaxID=1728934 RepID=A0ABW8TDL9_9CLOT